MSATPRRQGKACLSQRTITVELKLYEKRRGANDDTSDPANSQSFRRHVLGNNNKPEGTTSSVSGDGK